ncbi:DUF3291 domain-containing protein [Streptomyces sp. NPDC048638]|uniref:DUF3291 domain-containing protein n=1 Tax=Streptomyces sp. NPDC048638 TaxID=3365580 RepID=UPI003721CCC9
MCAVPAESLDVLGHRLRLRTGRGQHRPPRRPTLDNETLAASFATLDPNNAVADAADGLRLAHAEGRREQHVTRVLSDPQMAADLPVWREPQARKNYAYEAELHAQLRRRREWFEWPTEIMNAVPRHEQWEAYIVLTGDSFHRFVRFRCGDCAAPCRSGSGGRPCCRGVCGWPAGPPHEVESTPACSSRSAPDLHPAAERSGPARGSGV